MDFVFCEEEEEESKMVVTVEETEAGYFITWDIYDVNSSAITVMWCTQKSARTCEVHQRLII